MIYLTGMPDLQRKLNRLDEKIQKSIVKDALKETNLEIVLPAVEAKVPVLTGALKEGLKVKALNGRGKIGSAVFDEGYKGDQFYGSFQELGSALDIKKPSHTCAQLLMRTKPRYCRVSKRRLPRASTGGR